VSRLSRRQALTLAIVEAALGAAHVALTTGAMLTGVLMLLGSGAQGFAAAQAIAVVAQAAPMLLAGIMPAAPRERTIGALLGSRLLWVPALGVPLCMPAGWAVPVFLALYAANRVVDAVGQAAFLAWMSGVVPARVRGRFFARRGAVMLIATLVAGLAGGWVLDATGRSAAGFAVVIGASALCALGSAFAMARMPAVGGQAAGRGLSVSHLTAYARFRRFLVFFTLWGLATGFPAAYWNPFALQELRVSFTLLAMLAAVGSLAGAVCLPLWGRLADRVGDRTVLFVTIAWGSLHPLLWLMMTPDRLWPLWIDMISSGIVWNGFEVAATNLLLRLAPRGAGEVAYGSLAAVRGLSGAAAAVLAGAVYEMIPAGSGARMQVIFLICTVLRWSCLAFIGLVEDPRTDRALTRIDPDDTMSHSRGDSRAVKGNRL
jgi:hypothetical protein